MKPIKFFLSLAIVLLFNSCDKANLPKPTEVQYKWHEQERIMFVCLDPCTWQGREYDNHSIPLERINPKNLDTDQWCKVAQLWGANEILFVAKHTGGFCWWQTGTSDYSVKNTPYKNGNGDVLRELSASCKKYGLNLGIYVYPGDETWGAVIGSGGKTKDPSKQEAYNKVFRQQLTETLSNYGDVMEVWFDGSCVIDVSDILKKYASNAAILQGPQATLRWPGTESGKLFYPAWNTVMNEDLKTGVSTQIHGNPDGDAWAPLEADTPLYDHHWFWSPAKAKDKKSIDQLMDIYYKSVGHGGVLLLNSTPDTTGLIPAEDVKLYRKFGNEIKRRFSNPLANIESQKGKKITLSFDKPQLINHVIIMEDYKEGERIREYRIDGLINGKWKELKKGISVGRKKIDYFDKVETEKIRLVITKAAAKPLIRSLSAYYVDNFTPPPTQKMHVYAKPQVVSEWKKGDISNNTINLKIDLKGKINVPGQYILKAITEKPEQLIINDARVFYNGNRAMKEFVQIRGTKVHINRTAQVTSESDIVVELEITFKEPCEGKVEFTPEFIH